MDKSTGDNGDWTPHVGPTVWRKKPVEIEAMHFDGTLARAREIEAWSERTVYPSRYHEARNTCSEMWVRTLEGHMRADEGDYIIRGIKGEFYPCKPDIFLATYDLCLPDQAPENAS